MPSRTLASDAKINIASVSDLHAHFDDLYDDLHAPETEHTWQKIERALVHIQAITRGGATKYAEFVALLKDAAGPINNALLSERTKLSGTAGDLLNSIAPRMAERFEPLVAVFVPTLLLICARTNKVAVKRAEKSLHFIVKHCRPASVVVYLKEAIKDKGQGLRAVAAATLEVVLEHMEKDRLARRVGDVEACIKSGATDSNPEVRQTTKRLFELYVSIWPERVEAFTKPMTPTIRRYLSLPKTGALIVEVPPLNEAAPTTKSVSRAPPSTQQPSHSSRPDDLLLPASHAPPSRTAAPAPAYNFFPDLHKSAAAPSSSATRMQAGPGGFSMNDASYGKRGLFAEQIAAARNARLARMPSFNFDDLPKASSDTAPSTMKRQPSFDQLRAQNAAAPGAATFRVPRFDVVVGPSRQDSTDGRPSRSAHTTEAAPYRDINAATPSFAAASGLHGKSALLAAYKQAFAVESGAPKLASSSSSRDRQHRDATDKPAKHTDKRREKTVAVRFDSDSKHDEPLQHSTEGSAPDELRRSKSAPQIHVDKAPKPSGADADAKAADWADSDESDNERPSTPPERILHAQTPRTGVKASRVPAQRVAMMPSAVKVSAMRVAVPTPSAKVAAGRVAATSLSAESSPSGKSRGPVVKVDAAATQEDVALSCATQQKTEVNGTMAEEKTEVQEDKKEPATAKAKEDVKINPATAVKKPSTSTAASAKQHVKAVTAKMAPSASIAAKARLEARAASRPATATAATATAAESKKVAPRTVSTAVKPAVVRKPAVSSSTAAAAAKAVARPAATATASVKPNKPASTAKPTAATSAATARAKPAAATKPASAPAQKTTTTTAAAVKKPDPLVRTSSFMAPTASTRNKIVPAAAVKKFQPKATSSTATSSGGSSATAKARAKSSIAASLAAKSKVLGAPASDKANAVRRAAVGARMKVVGRGSAAAAAVGEKGVEKRDVGAAVPEKEEVVVEGSVAESVADVGSSAPAEADTEGEAEPKTQQQAEVAGTPADEAATTNDEPSITEPDSTVDPVPTVELAAEQDSVPTPSSDSITPEAQVDADPKQPQPTPAAADDSPHCTDPAPVSHTTAASTPAKTPTVANTTPAAETRTPLSSRDPNVPRPAAATPVTGDKIAASPLLRTRPLKPVTPSSPLRRTTPSPLKPALNRFAADTSSFEESDSESESEEEDTEQVVQLHFGPRSVPAIQQQEVAHKVVSAAAAKGFNKQRLVLGVDSSDDSGVMEAGEGDETVLLEHAV